MTTGKFDQLVGRLVSILFHQDNHLPTFSAQRHIRNNLTWTRFPAAVYAATPSKCTQWGKQWPLCGCAQQSLPRVRTKTSAAWSTHNATSAPMCRTPGLGLLEKKQNIHNSHHALIVKGKCWSFFCHIILKASLLQKVVQTSLHSWVDCCCIVAGWSQTVCSSVKNPVDQFISLKKVTTIPQRLLVQHWILDFEDGINEKHQHFLLRIFKGPGS